MEDKALQELSEVIQSSHINFLFGAGVSTPFLPLLGSIEQDLNQAPTIADKETHYKKYLTEVMIPNLSILNRTLGGNVEFEETSKAYREFFSSLTDVLIKRKSTILSKQANIFTTNIDILIECLLEELNIQYNDGFSGRFKPAFSLANFKKATFQRSLHFDHISEVPLINLIKIHGSLTWMQDDGSNEILFSRDLRHIDPELVNKTGADFEGGYRKILVVNPEEAKHLVSVLNVYYSELLRLYSSELEKENATLFIIGFSMEDKHIHEITLRAARSNPTLRVFVCCSQGKEEKLRVKMKTDQLNNIQILAPKGDGEKFKLAYFNEHILRKITTLNAPLEL